MLKSQVPQSPCVKTLFPTHKNPLISGSGSSSCLPFPLRSFSFHAQKKHKNIRCNATTATNIKALATSTTAEEKKVSVKATVIVKQTVSGFFSDFWSKKGLGGVEDVVLDWLGSTVLVLELVSAELDPKTGIEKATIKGSAHWKSQKDDVATFVADFKVPDSFGDVGAVLVENEHRKEMFIDHIDLDGFPSGPVTVTCGSWVQSKNDNPEKRFFFTNKSYLPSETPSGLRSYRESELLSLRGNGQGERKSCDRIYDYDVYNDIGDPDSTTAGLERPVLGGKQHPYPRRCRTGRARCEKDPLSEQRVPSRSGIPYVPRDEAFADVKECAFSLKKLYSLAHTLIPTLEAKIDDAGEGFPYFTKIDELYNQGINLPPHEKQEFWKNFLPRLVKYVENLEGLFFNFETPAILDKDQFSWFRDEEFSRQTLAGINPLSIQLVTEWPLKSKLDPKIYGPSESGITTEIVEREIGGFMKIEEAVKNKKLFVLDYHDLLLPYVHKVREIEGTTLYGSRTLFFLTPDGTLKILAIELVRPPSDKKPLWRQVFTPGSDATSCWLWRLAKTHVLAHDSGVHQLISHWLRTHCCTEPYIIATNRQLSAMHPIYRLLHPHFRYTMDINAFARESLINAGGIIETSFSPGKYCMELSSVAYDQLWQFNLEALPADLIHRGLAVEDPTAPYGLKLLIEDYPFANDGLMLWDAIKQWVSDYVNHFYPEASMVESDEEIKHWWTEIRTKGHPDKKDEPWWPVLKTPEDLIGIITTMVWVTSGHHAAVNFGQYPFGGYFPNRPTIARTNIPTEDPVDPQDWQFFLDRPDVSLLFCFPSQFQALRVLAVLDILSDHSSDEQYLGENVDAEPPWAQDPIIKAAFERFHDKMMEVEKTVDARNKDFSLMNRSGAGVVPYELLKPFSEPGVTGKGVPYSISI